MIETPFNYTGSKFKLLDQLIPIFDISKNRLVDLFSGGGSVYTNVVHLYNELLVNDIISDLMKIHKNLIVDKNSTVALVKSLVVAKDDKEGYHQLREDYNTSPTPEKLYALMLCCTNNMMRFNKKFKFNQTFGKRSFNPNTQKKIDLFSDHLIGHKDKIVFESKTFYQVECTENDFVYIDPPYSQTEAGYNSYWETNDDVGLFEYCDNLNKIGATFCVSGVETHDGKSCRLLNMLIDAGFKKHKIDSDYNKVSRKGDKVTQEIVIINYTR